MMLPGNLGRYELVELLASGGMGEVYVARQRSSIEAFCKLVAIKRLQKSYCEDEGFVEMLLDEARVVAALRHRNVVEVLDVDQEDGQYFIVMEYISGWTLRELLAASVLPRDVWIPPRLAAQAFADLARALGVAHQAGLVHRDVSPSNVMITESGVPKLIDFGIARATAVASMTTPGTLKGKYGYMAPEYIRGQPYDHRADLFSLGVVMWETLARRRLFKARNPGEQLQLVIGSEIPHIASQNAEVATGLAQVIHRALARDPDQRYESAAELASALESALLELPMSAEHPQFGHWLAAYAGDAIEHRHACERAWMGPARAPGEVTPRRGAAAPTFGEAPPLERMITAPLPLHPPRPATHAGPTRADTPQARRVEIVPGAESGTSLRLARGEQLGPASSPARPRRLAWLLATLLLGVTGAIVALLLADRAEPSVTATRPPSFAVAAAPTAAAPEAKPDTPDLAEAHRLIAIEAMKQRDYARARREVMDAIRIVGATDELSDLLVLIDDLEGPRELVEIEPAANLPAAEPVSPAADPVAFSPEVTPGPSRRPPRDRPRKKEEPRQGAKRDKRDEPTSPEIAKSPESPAASSSATGASTAEVAVPAAEPAGVIVVTSKPSRLTVVVDGRVAGTTPDKFSVPAGAHTIAISDGDRIVQKTRIEVAAGGTEFWDVAVPEPEPEPVAPPRKKKDPAAPQPPPRPVELGELYVISPNIVGEVFVDGIARGFPPVVIKKIPAGAVTVEIRVDGVVRRTKAVTIKPNKRRTVRLD